MDIKKYIESGILEEYCLGLLSNADQAYLIRMMLLYPEIKQELTRVELAMETWAAQNAVKPGDAVKQKVLASLGFNATDSFDMNRLPVVDESADLQTWLNTLNYLIPAQPNEDVIAHLIRKDEHYQQMLVITKADVPEEEHGDLLESFYILRGRCECTIGSQIHRLGPGDFLEIPMNVKHDIRMLTPHVVGILQYQFV